MIEDVLQQIQVLLHNVYPELKISRPLKMSC